MLTPKKKDKLLKMSSLSNLKLTIRLLAVNLFLASMAFLTLFPDGKGDPTNIAVFLISQIIQHNHFLRGSNI